MPLQHIAFGLLIDEPQFGILEWFRKQLMGKDDKLFPKFLNGGQRDDEWSTLYVPLLTFDIQDNASTKWQLDEIVDDLIRNEKKGNKVRPEIAKAFPDGKIDFHDLACDDHACYLNVSGTLPLATYLAQGIVAASYPWHCKVSFAHPRIKLAEGANALAFPPKYAQLPPTRGTSGRATRLMLLDGRRDIPDEERVGNTIYYLVDD